MRAATIGKASAKSGVKIETIRYYERIGLIGEPERTAGGNRVYDEDAISRLIFVRRSRSLGFSLPEIRQMLSMVDGGSLSCEDVHRIASDQIARIQDKIAILSRMTAVLREMASQCEGGDVPECPIIDALMEEEPELNSIHQFKG